VYDGALFLAVFLACVVEAVEAVTIVLAAGTARDWRSAGSGVIAGLAVLGLQWLRKAVLRASGHKALHDETQIFATELAAAQSAPAQRNGMVRNGMVEDWYAFTLSFKGVLLEGLEVAFIALTFGANQHNVPLAAIAALCAIVLVTAAGFALKAPLARVPENTLKFVVGIMLTSFGIFWGAEGAGAQWPGSDAALLVLVPVVALFALGLVAVMRRIGATTTVAASTEVEAS
jgi:uncharacterized membrane protein